MQRILLITGWGVGTQPLEKFQQALIRQGYEVELIDVFNALDTTDLDKHTQLAENFDVLMGWSLGGQLAALLAQQIHEKTGKAKILITLASNPCFVAKEYWPIGMSDSTFQSFKESYEKNSLTTLKRFCYLVTQGGVNAKQDWQSLQSLVDDQNKESKLRGLELLEKLNVADILKHYSGDQLHLFSEQDGLVAYQIIEEIKKLSAKFLTVQSLKGSHGFPIFNTDVTINKMNDYLKNRFKT